MKKFHPFLAVLDISSYYIKQSFFCQEKHAHFSKKERILSHPF